MLHASVDDVEYARRHNVNSDELAALAIPYDPEKLPQRMGVEIKVDGIGIIDVNGTIQTLEGVPFEAALHLAHELGALRQAFGTEMMLHGEFFEPGGFNATLSAFRAGVSTAGAVALWDAITLKAWHGHEQTPPLWMRRAQLEGAFMAVRPRMVVLNPLVPAGECSDAWVQGALANAVDDGHEGIVVKDIQTRAPGMRHRRRRARLQHGESARRQRRRRASNAPAGSTSTPARSATSRS
jgi:hypothetical protein